MILNNITLSIAGPICKCEYQNITILFKPDSDHAKTGAYAFVVGCGTCKTKVTIPREQITWLAKLDTPYPKGIKPREEKLEDGTVVDISDDFFKNYSKEIDNLSS